MSASEDALALAEYNNLQVRFITLGASVMDDENFNPETLEFEEDVEQWLDGWHVGTIHARQGRRRHQWGNGLPQCFKVAYLDGFEAFANDVEAF